MQALDVKLIFSSGIQVSHTIDLFVNKKLVCVGMRNCSLVYHKFISESGSDMFLLILCITIPSTHG